MIYQNDKNENTQNQFSNALKELQIGKLLRNSNITKSCGVSAYEVFQFLLLLVFQGRNLFRFLNSKHKDQAVSKNTYYRFLNETSYNWSRFLMLLAAKVTSRFDALTRPERIKVLVLDDSVVKRNRSKSVELLARVYDHVEHRFQKGFTCLHWGGLMVTVLSPLGLICFLLPKRAIVTMKYLKILIIVQTVISSVKKA